MTPRAESDMQLGYLPAWVPTIVVGATLARMPVGTLTAFALAFVPCRRYLPRLAGSTMDIA